MSKGIIVAGFGAIGKTTLGNKYNNIIDLESGYYQCDNTGFENIPYEKKKRKKKIGLKIRNGLKIIIKPCQKLEIIMILY